MIPLQVESQIIEHVSIFFTGINSMAKFDEYRQRGTILLNLLERELEYNNQGPSQDYTKYLVHLKDHLLKYFIDVSVDDSTEYNLKYYARNSSKITDRENKLSIEEIERVFFRSLNDEYLASLEIEKVKHVQDNHSIRKIGALPYTYFQPSYRNSIIAEIENKGLADHFLAYQSGELDEAASQFDLVRKYYSKLLSYEFEQDKSHFLRLVIGQLLISLDVQDGHSKSMVSCFKNPADYNMVIASLKDKEIIDESNHWVGIDLLLDGRPVFDKNYGAINALIDVLNERQYLRKQPKSLIAQYFDTTFAISRTKESRLKLLARNDHYIDFFGNLFPNNYISRT